MSANIVWVPVETNTRSLSTGAPSSFWDTLERAFGKNDDSFHLHTDHLATLQGIRAAQPSEPAWDELIEAVREHGPIRVWREY